MTRRLVALALAAGLVGGAARAAAAPPASQPASQPALVPPALVRFTAARLPPELELAPGRYVVELALTIGADGAVMDASARSGAHPALARLALGAARAFRFTPARIGNTPVPVCITYRYTFDVQPRARQVVFVVTLREKGTRHPVTGVTAVIEETGASVTARDDRLEIADLPPGRYTLFVPPAEHAEARLAFTVTDGPPGAARLILEPRPGALNQTVIRAPIEARSVARQSLEVTELARLPGSGGDALKMVENLPGIARSPYGTGQLVVFGSPPSDSLVMLDSLPIGQLYHLGGLYSVIHPDFIERIDFVPAGFDASYGHVTGGIVDVKLRETPLAAWHAALDVNVLHAGVIVGGPYSENGDVQAAFRRSYIDGILGAAVGASDTFAMTAAPRYYDYQLKWQHRLGSHHRFLVFVNGADDEMVFASKRANMDDPTFVGDMGMRSAYHGALARWSYEPSSRFRNALSLAANYTGWGLDVFHAMSFRLRQAPVMPREELEVRLGRTLKLHAGLEAIAQWMSVKVRSPEPPADGAVAASVSLQETITSDERAWEYAVSPFLSLEWQPVPRLTVVPSLRVEAWSGYRSWTYADPRLSTRLRLTDTVTLRLAGGLYQKPPDAVAWSANFGNPHIGPEAAVHLIGGGEWAPTPLLSIGGNVFSKWMFHLAEPLADATLRYDNRGRGRAYGGDVLVRVRPGGRFFGWIAYTYVRAERYDFDAGAYRPSAYDQRHLLNVVGSYRLPHRWTVGARFRLTSGFPYTPIVGASFDTDADRFSPIASPARNSARMPVFHALDLRVDKEWVMTSWKLGVYLELQNAYNAVNADAVGYNYDYTRRGWVRDLPILPVFGVCGEL